MDQFLNVFMLCLIFAHAKSEECSGIKLGKTGCVPQQHLNTIYFRPTFENPKSPLPISILMEKYRVTEIDISSGTMTIFLDLVYFWEDKR